MATEVTQAGWAAVARPLGVEHAPSYHRCADADGQCPVERVSIAEVVWFANAASKAAGLEPCYDAALLGRCPHNPFESRCAPSEIGCGDVCGKEARAALRSRHPGCTGFRLPDRDEWAYAARAGSSSRHVGGDDTAALDRVAWYAGNAGGTSHPVARLAPNRWGLYDVQGNAQEWTADVGWRGCGFLAAAAACNLAIGPSSKTYTGRSGAVGFRLVRDPPPGGP